MAPESSPPGRPTTLGLTALAMLAFAANSLLVRAALVEGAIDPATLTLVRLGSGACILLPLLRGRLAKTLASAGQVATWRGAISLLAYAGLFSFAYVKLGAGTGALLAFGAVQVTMVVVAAASGERPSVFGLVGMAIASAGLVLLVLPGLTSPPLLAAILMLGAGAAWGLYSHFGREAKQTPQTLTAQNFLYATLLALPLFALHALFSEQVHVTTTGVGLAAISGAVTSGLGYVIWYRALVGLTATAAGAVQLSAPFLATAGGVFLLGETFHLRLLIGGVLVLGGIALSLRKAKARAAKA